MIRTQGRVGMRDLRWTITAGLTSHGTSYLPRGGGRLPARSSGRRVPAGLRCSIGAMTSPTAREAPVAPAGPAAPGAPPAPAPAREFDPELLTRLFPPYKVVVHNNDYNTFDEVIHILVKAVPGMSHERAAALANEIHATGA